MANKITHVSLTFALFCLFIIPTISYADDILIENERYHVGIVSNATDSQALDLHISITDKQEGIELHPEETIIFTTSTGIKDAFFLTESAFLVVFYYEYNHNGMLLTSISENGRVNTFQFRVGLYALDPQKKIMVHSNWGYGRPYIQQIDINSTIASLKRTTDQKPKSRADIIVDRTIFDVFMKHPNAYVSDIKWVKENTFELELSEHAGQQYKYLISGVKPKDTSYWADVSVKQVHDNAK